MPQGKQVVYTISEAGDAPQDTNLVYESSSGFDDREFLKAQSERRKDLNKFRNEYQFIRDEEERLDRVKSKNWRVTIDGETHEGYDVIRQQRGELGEDITPPRSQKVLNAVFHYGYS